MARRRTRFSSNARSQRAWMKPPSERTARLIGAIVAGGASTRFGGEPKGLRQVGGRRIIDRVADALRGVVNEIVLVANAAEADMSGSAARGSRETAAMLAAVSSVSKRRCRRHKEATRWWSLGHAICERRAAPLCRLSLVIADSRRRARASRRPGAVLRCSPRVCLPLVERQLAHGDLRVASFIDNLPVVRRMLRASCTRSASLRGSSSMSTAPPI